MMYQVLKWSRHLDGWVPLPRPTTNAHTARLHLSQARRYCAGAVLVQAETAQELACQVRHVQQSRCRPASAALPQLQPQPQPLTLGAQNTVSRDATRAPYSAAVAVALHDDARRWALERGPGGDHDEPYRFALPMEAVVMYHWLHLLSARVQRQEVFG